MKKKLHIVSFDVPYPANYGGVIDVFYKIKALYELNVDIYLHVYEYGRGFQKELENYCVKIFYYKRKKLVLNLNKNVPYRVLLRSDKELIKNLKKIKAPILFEGLHTCFPLLKEDFIDRSVLVRSHNIEHLYFLGLSMSERNSVKRFYFKKEAKKLKRFEKILHKADKILSISPSEQDYFMKKYHEKAVYIPVFHQNEAVSDLSSRGNFALYHGDLRIADNIKAVFYLADIFKELPFQLIIAGSSLSRTLKKRINQQKNLAYVDVEKEVVLDQLLQEAHINVLPTFQKTGIKLKLINALFKGRFCVANNLMVEETGLEQLCEIVNTKVEFREKIKELFQQDYPKNTKEVRSEVLETFNTKLNASKICELI